MEKSPTDEVIVVKISEDGAKFSKTSSFFLLTFCLPFLSSNALSSSGKLFMYYVVPTHCMLLPLVGNHTFAAVRALEDYDTLATSLNPVLDDINKLLGAKEVIVCERIVKLNFYLGGDYKVLYLQFTPLKKLISIIIASSDVNGIECCQCSICLPVVHNTS